MTMDAGEYACCFSIKHGNLPFLHTHLMSCSGKILGLPTGQTFCLHLLLAVRDRAPSEPCQVFPENAAAVAAACTGILTLCTISPVVHLHSAHIQLKAKKSFLPGIKSYLFLTRVRRTSFPFQQCIQAAFTLTQHFNGKSTHPGHGGLQFNSLLHLREGKSISSGHTLATSLHKGIFSFC